MTHPTDAELVSLRQGHPETSDLGPHVASCEHCQERSTRLAAELDAIRFTAGFRETRQRVAAAVERRSRRRWWSFGGLSLVATAALVLFVQPKAPPAIRTKGAPAVHIVRSDGHSGPLHVGERVSLVLHPSHHRYALLIAVDESGTVAQVWPATEAQSGTLSDVPEVVLQSGFDITPGSFVLHAFLSDAPLRAADAIEALRLQKDSVPGEKAHATLDVVVAER